MGLEVTQTLNWNPECPEHGLESEWWNSPEQVALRAENRQRLIKKYREAAEARRKAREQ